VGTAAWERLTAPAAAGLASHGWTDHQAASFMTQCREAGFADVCVERHTPGRRAVLVVTAPGRHATSDALAEAITRLWRS
jgi:hypothetical protein